MVLDKTHCSPFTDALHKWENSLLNHTLEINANCIKNTDSKHFLSNHRIRKSLVLRGNMKSLPKSTELFEGVFLLINLTINDKKKA